MSIKLKRSIPNIFDRKILPRLDRGFMHEVCTYIKFVILYAKKKRKILHFAGLEKS